MIKLLIIGGFINSLICLISALNFAIVMLHSTDLTSIKTELGAQYECGFIPFSDARLQFEVQFYLVSLLFVVFDVEVALLLPYSLIAAEAGFHGFYLLVSFFVLLGLGFIVEWQSGILNLARGVSDKAGFHGVVEPLLVERGLNLQTEQYKKSER